jgi:hypothetical protein
MDQKAYLSIAALLNAFPQSSSDPDLTLRTFEAVLKDIPAQAVIEASERFMSGLVPEQSDTFAPSPAKLAIEARRIAGLLPYRGMKSLSKPRPYFYQEPKAGEKVRMGFKMSVLSASFGRKDGADMVAEANARGLEDLIALGQSWGVPVPEELWAQLGQTAA